MGIGRFLTGSHKCFACNKTATGKAGNKHACTEHKRVMRKAGESKGFTDKGVLGQYATPVKKNRHLCECHGLPKYACPRSS